MPAFSAPTLWCFKGDPLNLGPEKVRDLAGTKGGKPRIRCPACAWEPQREDLWSCVCLFAWNTFDTFGVCPSCDRKWTETQCLKCRTWSRHKDWYTDGGDSNRE